MKETIMKWLRKIAIGGVLVLTLWNLWLCYITNNSCYTDVWFVLLILTIFNFVDEVEK